MNIKNFISVRPSEKKIHHEIVSVLGMEFDIKKDFLKYQFARLFFRGGGIAHI